MPQVFTYTQSTTGGALPIRFSAVSLDRTSTPHSLVVSEYGWPGRDQLWSLTEHPNQRSVFAIRPSAY